MEDVTIINFPKNKITAEVVKGGQKESSLNDRASIGEQLVNYASDDKLKFEIRKITGDKNFSGHPFVMQNKDNKIFINFEDRSDPYFDKIYKIYLEKKIKKSEKVKRIKVFTTRVVATVLTTAAIGGLAYMAGEAYFHELDETIKENRMYYQEFKQQEEADKRIRKLNEQIYIEDSENVIMPRHN